MKLPYDTYTLVQNDFRAVWDGMGDTSSGRIGTAPAETLELYIEYLNESVVPAQDFENWQASVTAYCEARCQQLASAGKSVLALPDAERWGLEF